MENSNTVKSFSAMESSIDYSIKQLSYSFYKATRNTGTKAIKGTDLYELQVEFSYMLDNIRRGPQYISSKLITTCNEFINTEIPRVLKLT